MIDRSVTPIAVAAIGVCLGALHIVILRRSVRRAVASVEMSTLFASGLARKLVIALYFVAAARADQTLVALSGWLSGFAAFLCLLTPKPEPIFSPGAVSRRLKKGKRGESVKHRPLASSARPKPAEPGTSAP